MRSRAPVRLCTVRGFVFSAVRAFSGVWGTGQGAGDESATSNRQQATRGSRESLEVRSWMLEARNSKNKNRPCFSLFFRLAVKAGRGLCF